ncbi:hypothetical protein Q2304_03700, partial [Escherichia coli]|nr:hypothetical protein [Escherichia coli]
QKLAEYLVLYNSKRPHKALALMTPVEYILKENKNCNMWWTHTGYCFYLTYGFGLVCETAVYSERRWVMIKGGGYSG